MAHLFTVFFERTRIPDVFFLILIGLVLGPVLKIVTPEDFGRVGSILTVVALVVILLRIPVVRCSIPNSYSQKDVSLMAIMVPKGLVATVLAGVPLQESMPNAEWVQSIVYAIVLFSIMFCTLMAFLLQRPGPLKTYSNLFQNHNIETPKIAPSMRTYSAMER